MQARLSRGTSWRFRFLQVLQLPGSAASGGRKEKGDMSRGREILPADRRGHERRGCREILPAGRRDLEKRSGRGILPAGGGSSRGRGGRGILPTGRRLLSDLDSCTGRDGHFPARGSGAPQVLAVVGLLA